MSKGSEFSIHCQSCSFSHLCLPVSLNKTELDSLDDIIERKKPLHKHDKLVKAGDKFNSLYAVRAGSFKSFVSSKDGEEQIIGFHFPGDIIGFDALRENAHQSYTQALETAMVCELPYETLDKMAVQFPKLRHQIMSFMSAEIKQDHDLMMLLNKRTAEERLIYFLAHLSKRFEDRGFSPRQYNLSMTRNEIGNYLGLTVETISRLLTRFQKEGIIKVDGKLITILDFEAMDNKLHSMDIPSTTIS
ncbi:MAG: fumarate/nitrate reduction transcriptional regulator Fnr [Pseudomonadota bacterium]|jgi:CRP/FNR family transcriptional regulator|uniref:Fumarate/nitrate reduction transcriptional regulator Fnr n=1 Tax=Alteromonas oceani TaxID=2071609 RepID=A0ABV7JZL2_9ALTE|nr:fumarate/nitrate reduction transcriptional regulator Fnr [Alteromonas oceani]MAQ00770.1 transcriptional regulator FNR [Alteromonadaceae bacterium]MDY6928539.1 fumarate/nitrate reduction transcriptional regulator Fnr [Pseudomonadota bacterium]HCA75293.1 transcriptional regulator FNR [Alteromonas sp.]HCB08193.1 transcriptional regulator FNR [Alteromonas sp.]HCB16042.1 transcriptional regulator FNR [Alteromonas sp.]|tara:strand:- start:1870 stop:2607 length:738 start_codon:yes stop_codon:yes gene_type:complete